MGEAKEKAKRAALVSVMHVSRDELVALMLYLVRPVAQPGGGMINRGTRTRDERRKLERALDQLGVTELYDKVQDGVLKNEDRDQIPVIQVRELTKETVEHLLANILTDMSHAEGLQLRHFERRLEDVKDDKYEVPEKHRHLVTADTDPASPAETT